MRSDHGALALVELVDRGRHRTVEETVEHLLEGVLGGRVGKHLADRRGAVDRSSGSSNPRGGALGCEQALDLRAAEAGRPAQLLVGRLAMVRLDVLAARPVDLREGAGGAIGEAIGRVSSATSSCIALRTQNEA